MSKILSDKIALVTGASRGIGRAIALSLAREGALVAVHYGKSPDAAAEVVEKIKAEGGDAFAVGADLTKKGAAQTLFAAFDAEVKKRKGDTKFDILVNNAGVGLMGGLSDTSENVLDEIYNVNVKSLFLITQEAVKRLRPGGRIISTSSVVSRVPVGSLMAYSMLKPPLDNFTKSLAVDLGSKDITVNAIAPGVIDTDMAAGFVSSEEGRNFALSRQALKRIGKPEEIADVVSFLAGPKSRWVTGQVIEISGGSALTF
jgi:NAD(P)-dependent dehydrogenase (short-subunit alcohol dehydrogenase family)